MPGQGLKRQLPVTKGNVLPAGGCDRGAPRRQLQNMTFVAGTIVKSPVRLAWALPRGNRAPIE